MWRPCSNKACARRPGAWSLCSKGRPSPAASCASASTACGRGWRAGVCARATASPSCCRTRRAISPLIYALILSGLVWVPVNTRLRAVGLQYLLRHAGPRLLVAEDEYAEAIEQARQDGVPLASGTDIDAVAARADVAPAALPPVRIRHADTLCIIYTSGTTGAPKGVLFTHRMMRIASEATLRVANAKAGDRLFVWEPLCHIGGAQMLMVPFLEPVQLHVVERFSASRFWAQWRDAGTTHLHYLGGILDILAQAPQPPQSYIRTAGARGRPLLGCDPPAPGLRDTRVLRHDGMRQLRDLERIGQARFHRPSAALAAPRAAGPGWPAGGARRGR